MVYRRRQRVPILGTVGVGNPLVGPMPGVPNAFEACVFSFGIAQAGGAGKILAEWMSEGETEWDMWLIQMVIDRQSPSSRGRG